MGRPKGSNNIKESNRQAAVRLVTKEGKGRGEVVRILQEMGASISSAIQYYYYAKRVEKDLSKLIRVAIP